MPGLNLTIGTLITADEEWAAVNGSDKVLSWMKQNGKNPDSFIIGEPSSQDYLGTHVKVGRRGSLVGYLEAGGVQGHRAYEELFENTRALRHDLKNHFGVIYLLAEQNQDKEVINYVQRFLDMSDNGGYRISTGNVSLDALISYKYEEDHGHIPEAFYGFLLQLNTSQG